MVATVSALSSASQAQSYFTETAEYYADGGEASTQWRGTGASALGLEGAVTSDDFRALLDGVLPGGQRLGTTRNGELLHRPGTDLTLSAPKSVSVMALVAGDVRLIAAHDRAATVAFEYAERHGAASRIRDGGQVETIHSENLVAASFRHDTNRSEGPQLHSHHVVLNMTMDADKNWRSLESRPLFQLQKAIGEIYRQQLALDVRRLGYEIEAGKDSTFEIKGVPKTALEAFSERSAQIETHLAARGKTRQTASAAEKQIATLETRPTKKAVDRAELSVRWAAQAEKAGFGLEARQAFVSDARSRASDMQRTLLIDGEAQVAAMSAVKFAAAKLGERNSVFPASELEREAGRRAMGLVGNAEIKAAVNRAVEFKDLSPRTHLDRRGIEGAGFTTAINIAHEKKMLLEERRGRGIETPLANDLEAARLVAKAALTSSDKGLQWTQDQKAATKLLLTSRNRTVGLQGLAGTAKTSTVLSTYAKIAAAEGMTVRALGPSASAAQTLGEALGLEGQTLARHLNKVEESSFSKSGRREVWIVDEASLVSARDMSRLLEAGAKHGARTILSGDVHQLGSVGAGAAFAQLQARGLHTAVLKNIVRQTNAQTLDAVQAVLEGKMRKALEALDAGGGRVVEARTPEERYAAIARDFAALSAQERARTIVIDPSRDGRDALTEEIRNVLIANGALGARSAFVNTLVPKDLTSVEAKSADSYNSGDVVIFNKQLSSKQISRGDAFTVMESDKHTGIVELVGDRNRKVQWRPGDWGQTEAFVLERREVRVGDRLEFTRNDASESRVNGARLDVISISERGDKFKVRTSTGSLINLSTNNLGDAHLRHAFVQTAHAAQGRTADRVMAHAESGRANLIDRASMYVAVSRAKSEAVIYPDDRNALIGVVAQRSQSRQTAMEM